MKMSNASRVRSWAMIGVLCLGLVAATALILALIPARPVHGFLCGLPSFMESVDWADAVFEGKAISRESLGTNSLLREETLTEFKVLTVWKGDVPPVVTVRGYGAPYFNVAHTYVVFASEWTEAENNARLALGKASGRIGFSTDGCNYPYDYDYRKGIVDEPRVQLVPRIALATLIALGSIAGVVRWRMRRRQQDAVSPS